MLVAVEIGKDRGRDLNVMRGEDSLTRVDQLTI